MVYGNTMVHDGQSPTGLIANCASQAKAEWLKDRLQQLDLLLYDSVEGTAYAREKSVV